MSFMSIRRWGALFAIALVGAAQEPISPTASKADRDEYRELSSLIRPAVGNGAKSDQPPRTGITTSDAVSELRRLVRQTALTALQAPNATSKSVADTIRDLQGENAFDAAYPFTGIPRADVAEVNGLPTAVVASAVLDGGIGVPGIHPSFQFYSKTGGEWTLRQELGVEFEGRVFSIAPIKSPISNEVRYFVWGSIVGHSAPPLRCRLYAFNGFEVRTLWERDGLRSADVLALTADEIELEYYTYPPVGVYVPPTRVVERWRSSPGGLIQVETP